VKILNLGILAHVDAGKTSLTERLLYEAGVITRIGSVDAGDTQTDSMELERQRGITIQSAVVSFVVDDVTINLIDTPGHPDFIAEVERVLNVLDGAVLVVAAVEGVQAQTRVLFRTLKRLRIPTIIFVNKIDRRGAQYSDLLKSIADKLDPAIIAMSSVTDLGTRDASSTVLGHDDVAFRSNLSELLADHDDAFLAAYLEDERGPTYDRLRTELAAQTGRARVHPVYFGSAITGAGHGPLVEGITTLLPTDAGDVDGPVSGTVFKVARSRSGERTSYVRMFSGVVRLRDRVSRGGAKPRKVTGIQVFERGSAVRRPEVRAGQIAQLSGLDGFQVGDVVGEAGPGHGRRFFAPPSLEAVVIPQKPAAIGALYSALTQLAEQDPLINVRQDEVHREIAISLYGEVQKEVIQATLANEFDIEVTFSETTTICVERLAGSGSAVEILKQGDNPFMATIGLRLDPASVGNGINLRLEVELGSLPHAYLRAIEDTAHATLRQGLYGWNVVDCVITLTHAGYVSMISTAADFRHLAPLVLADALREAGTVVHEPVHRFRLDVPADTIGAVLPLLAQVQAVPRTPEAHGWSSVVEGDIPAAQVHALAKMLPGLTRGEGVLESTFDRYEPVRREPPVRARADNNPLNRKEYLLHVTRRV